MVVVGIFLLPRRIRASFLWIIDVCLFIVIFIVVFWILRSGKQLQEVLVFISSFQMSFSFSRTLLPSLCTDSITLQGFLALSSVSISVSMGINFIIRNLIAAPLRGIWWRRQIIFTMSIVIYSAVVIWINEVREDTGTDSIACWVTRCM